jgi:hypothetical protein
MQQQDRLMHDPLASRERSSERLGCRGQGWHIQRQSVLVAPTCGFVGLSALKSISEEKAPVGER